MSTNIECSPKWGLRVFVGLKEGNGKIVEASGTAAEGLYLLFAKGKRPDPARITTFANSQTEVSISHDPAAGQLTNAWAEESAVVSDDGGRSAEDETFWVELLRGGLTFDLHGLAPGDPVPFTAAAHRFDLERVPTAVTHEAIRLTPGRHLAGGQTTLPVAKGLLAVARDVMNHFEAAEAVFWPPSASAIGRRYFDSVATAWIEGGPFPALGLTAFIETMDGALQSVGLDHWIGQELRIESPLSSDRIAATRLGVRLVNQLVMVGGVEGDERIVAPDGNRLILRVSRNGRFVRVMRE